VLCGQPGIELEAKITVSKILGDRPAQFLSRIDILLSDRGLGGDLPARNRAAIAAD